MTRLTLKEEYQEEAYSDPEDGDAARAAPLREALSSINIEISDLDVLGAVSEYSFANFAISLDPGTKPLHILQTILPYCDVETHSGNATERLEAIREKEMREATKEA